MDVIISENKGSKVFHRPGCFYAERISPDFRFYCSEKKAIKQGYCACKYCSGTEGLHRINRKVLKETVADKKMDSFYDASTSAFYIKTDIGFWKFGWSDKSQGYILLHRNSFDPALSRDDLMKGPFHRQRDFSASYTIDVLVKYIEDHDKAKKIISDDYRKLPKTTKKQKKYYRQAKKRAQREQAERVDRLFALIAQHSANSAAPTA